MAFHKMSSDERYMLAKTTTDSKIIEQFSHHEDPWVRIFVAQNINTSSETLEFLSHDRDFVVRYAVALNPNTSLETLRQMAIHDKVYYVRILILQHPNCDDELYMYIQGRFLLK